ncbi:hypothetical protein EHQ24_14275 [Leptospira noumeaensis]|uniref:Lipoprotein n=1 Tax=Leptospira noumeaensis TaxID=2484964 RepID=A0A4R9I8L9_9LEPT|nr:hypothetical protein [Leptospira noumeaensis]TGK82413.1 hypothetical protein EHQ24_14275 [Leptospira noumeaensis]
MKLVIIILLFVLSFVSCVDPEKKSRSNAQGFFVIWFETLFRSSGYYDPACDDPNRASPITFNSPISLAVSNESKKFRLDSGPNGFRYSFTLSSDYPGCGVMLFVSDCNRPNVFATNTTTQCDSGTFKDFFPGGTQTCIIPSFGNKVVIVNLQSYLNSQPNLTKCSTITFEALP